MPRPEAKSLRRPEQVRRFPNGRIETVSHRETTIGRFSLEPGWRWSRDVGPIAQTHSCQIHHLGVVLKGRLRVETDAGEVCEFEVDDVYDIPPGHDATVVGDETFEAIEFASARIFAMPTDGDRVLAAVLCTDIVDSTSHLRRLGDSAWRELLTEHNRQTRGELNRFRGREIQTIGDCQSPGTALVQGLVTAHIWSLDRLNSHYQTGRASRFSGTSTSSRDKRVGPC
jgi:uncharacterized cupin superfamily protein